MSLAYDVLKDDVRAGSPIDFGFVTYVPERTCRIVYDNVHQDYYCSSCGEYFDTGMYVARDSDDWLEHKDFRYCPNCGAKVAGE